MNIFDVRREKGLGMANRAGVDECMSMLGVIMEDISLLTSSDSDSFGLRLIRYGSGREYQRDR